MACLGPCPLCKWERKVTCPQKNLPVLDKRTALLFFEPYTCKCTLFHIVCRSSWSHNLNASSFWPQTRHPSGDNPANKNIIYMYKIRINKWNSSLLHNRGTFPFFKNGDYCEWKIRQKRSLLITRKCKFYICSGKCNLRNELLWNHITGQQSPSRWCMVAQRFVWQSLDFTAWLQMSSHSVCFSLHDRSD